MRAQAARPARTAAPARALPRKLRVRALAARRRAAIHRELRA
jgi:hypothetical protein